ncbi:MAG: dihydrodipicolinate synthase family protein [Fimbriimonadaceae bacterium]|nr:dihydrodipicolinate synthase family protein [Fimbriimonadaceae bacterium]QYK59177.1 MAG: dihydrodipicolinate synthase family protein [Fimbriimonadaceae bacterium]
MKFFVPLPSPFTDDTTTASEIRLARAVRFHREHGAAGYLVGSDAGEGMALAHSERKSLVEWVVRESQGAPVVVGVTASTTSSVLDLCQHAARHGAQAALLGSPPGGPWNEQEIKSLLSAVRRYANLPCLWLGGEEFQVIGTTDTVEFKSLNEVGPISLGRAFAAEECSVFGSVVTPLAVLGADQAKRVVDQWASTHLKAKSLFVHGRSARVAKAVLERHKVEVGPPRGPMKPLDKRGEELLASLLAQLG